MARFGVFIIALSRRVHLEPQLPIPMFNTGNWKETQAVLLVTYYSEAAPVTGLSYGAGETVLEVHLAVEQQHIEQ